MNRPPSVVVYSTTMPISLRTLLCSLALGLALVGCGGSDIGEACDTGGSTDECVDGAICTNDSAGNVCREICDTTADCAAGYSCNGVTGGSIKSCQPDPI